MARTFTHAPTGRTVVVLEGSTLERLVVADGNWTEVKPVKAKTENKTKTVTKEASNGARSGVRRRSASRSIPDIN